MLHHRTIDESFSTRTNITLCGCLFVINRLLQIQKYQCLETKFILFSCVDKFQGQKVTERLIS